jgi:hypothetical protein
MKINEIITESTELEEGWKSKLGAAALAGAAALGGGAADAGGGYTLNVVGKTYDALGNTIVKYQDGSTRNLGTNVWTSPTMAQTRQIQAQAKQKADREAAIRASRQSNYAQKNMPQQQNFQPKFDPTQDPFLMDRSSEIDKDIGKFKSYLESNPTASEKNNVMKQIDSRIKYYFDDIEEVKAARGVSSEENAYLVKKIQELAKLKDTKIASTPSKYGDTVVIEPEPNNAPSSAQSPKAPDAKQANSDAGWPAKTTGKATGITKNGDQYTGTWADGLANGSGERTLVNKGYTGGLVKTGNKLDTEWKNGMPVDGAKVKVTRSDGTVFNGHIKRGDENPWGYMIVK